MLKTPLRSIVKLAAWGALLLWTTLAAAAERPNIVLFFADDLGINDLSCYGRRDQSTPSLDRLASQGMRFTCSYCAQPICSASRAALMTGKTPGRLHLTTFLPGRPDAASQKLLHPKIQQQLPLEEVTIAERLRATGYATACIGKWHLGGVGFEPTRQGFDIAFAGRANTQPSADEGGKGESELTDHAVQFIREHRDGPFFLYLPHNTPHVPLAAQADRVAKFSSAFNPIYAAMIESLDECVSRIVATLDELKLADNTLVIFTSDNGGLHVPETPHTPATHNTPFRAGKGYVYEGGLRVPLIVRLPGRISPAVVDTPVVNTDWSSTLLELADIERPADSDGVSLLPLLTGSGKLAARMLMWHFPHYTNQGGRPAGAIRDGDWKLVEHYEDGRKELFNLAQDPGEERDLASGEASRVADLSHRLAAWRNAIGAQENTLNPNFDPTAHAKIYEAIDTSRLPSADTAAAAAIPLRDWRAAMDAAVRGKKSKK